MIQTNHILFFQRRCLVANIDKESLEEFPRYMEAVMKHVEPGTHNNLTYSLFCLTRYVSGNPIIVLNHLLASH